MTAGYITDSTRHCFTSYTTPVLRHTPNTFMRSKYYALRPTLYTSKKKKAVICHEYWNKHVAFDIRASGDARGCLRLGLKFLDLEKYSQQQ